MPDLEIDYQISGFLKNAEYRMPLTSIIQGYATRFGEAASLTVHLEEVPYQQLSIPPKSGFDISPDGKAIVIHYYDWRYYDKKGKLTGSPLLQSVSNGLRTWLDRAADEYMAQFPPPANDQ